MPERGQKLVSYIISLFSRICDTILDLFVEMGTLGLAARYMDFHVIMIENGQCIYDRLLKPFTMKVCIY